MSSQASGGGNTAALPGPNSNGCCLPELASLSSSPAGSKQHSPPAANGIWGASLAARPDFTVQEVNALLEGCKVRRAAAGPDSRPAPALAGGPAACLLPVLELHSMHTAVQRLLLRVPLPNPQYSHCGLPWHAALAAAAEPCRRPGRLRGADCHEAGGHPARPGATPAVLPCAADSSRAANEGAMPPLQS